MAIGTIKIIRALTVCATAALALTAASARAAPLDPAAAYTLTNGNPNGPYTYGFEESLGGTLSLFTTATTLGPIDKWYTPTEDFYLGVYKAPSTDTLLLHPGETSQVAVLRLTIPQSGTFTIGGAFSNGDTATTDVHVVVNGTSLFDGVIDFDSVLDPFGIRRTLVAGDTVDFVVGNDGNGNYNDSTLLTASIAAVPEPAGLGMLAGGLLGLAALRRARKT